MENQVNEIKKDVSDIKNHIGNLKDIFYIVIINTLIFILLLVAIIHFW